MYRRFFAIFLLGVAFISPTLAHATDKTTVLNPGFLKIEAEGDYHVLELFGFIGGEEYSFQRMQVVYPLRLHYGLARGAEVALTLPISSRILFSTSNQSLTGRIWDGLGDLEGGMKLKLISDTEDTPAIFVEALLKIPTGHSRFRDYVQALDNPHFPIAGTDTATVDLILKGIISMFLDPAEIYLELKIDIPGADDFRHAGGHEHIDYGSIISLFGGMEIDLADEWVGAFEIIEISTAAATWRRNGIDALEQAGEASSALAAQTRAQAGVTLSNLAELYIGPALTYIPWPYTQVKVFALLGLTPDSETFRLGATLSTAFSIGQIFEFRRGKAVSPPPQVESPVVADLPKPIFLPEPAEAGNKQRFIKRQTDRAQRARLEGHLGLALKEIKQILLQYPDYAPAQMEYDQIKLELDTVVKENLELSAQALKENHLLNAVQAWRKILTLDPAQPAALDMLRDYDQEIRKQAKEFYLEGMQHYVRGNYEKAVAVWEQARVLNPGDPKLQDSIVQTRKKIQLLKQLNP